MASQDFTTPGKVCKNPECLLAGISLPATAFYELKQMRDGLTAECRECIKARSKRNRIIRQEQISERKRQRYAAMSEEEHTKHLARCKHNYCANKESRAIQAKLYRENNKKVISIRKAQYYQDNKKEICAARKLYFKTHKTEAAVLRARRIARKSQAERNDLTAAEWRAIQEIFHHRCAYCGKRAKGHLTQDHMTPLSKGGNHTLHNVIPACKSCNSKKHVGPVLKQVQPILLLAV